LYSFFIQVFLERLNLYNTNMPDNFKFIEIDKEEEYQPLLIRSDCYFTQSYFYGECQKDMGRKVRRFKVLKDSKALSFFQVIKYPIPFGKSYLYVPHGPVTSDVSTEDLLKFFKSKMAEVADQEQAVFLRFDFYPSDNQKIIEKFFKKAPYYSYRSAFFQSKFDWALNIEKSEEEILAGMHQKTRYNIRLAEKKNVNVKMVSGEDLMNYFESFYALLKETGERGKFALHPKAYYESIFKKGFQNKDIVLFVAKYNDEILATHLVIFYGDTAFYPFGGSSRSNKNLMAPYLVHWRAMQEAKKRNCKWYNFGAIDVGEKVKHDNWDGISSFKQKFGGQLLEFGDFYDQTFDPFLYTLYNLRKRIKYK